MASQVYGFPTPRSKGRQLFTEQSVLFSLNVTLLLCEFITGFCSNFFLNAKKFSISFLKLEESYGVDVSMATMGMTNFMTKILFQGWKE